jgi:hypothetical protein
MPFCARKSKIQKLKTKIKTNLYRTQDNPTQAKNKQKQHKNKNKNKKKTKTKENKRKQKQITTAS